MPLLLILVPLPQVAEQLFQSLHGPNAQSTEMQCSVLQATLSTRHWQPLLLRKAPPKGAQRALALTLTLADTRQGSTPLFLILVPPQGAEQVVHEPHSPNSQSEDKKTAISSENLERNYFQTHRLHSLTHLVLVSLPSR